MVLEQVRSVVIIDDDPINNMACEIIIKSTGFSEEIESFQKADEALNHLIERAETDQDLPSVILLDINMGEMNGWEFMEHYRESVINHFDFDRNDLPKVFIVSSSVNKDDIQRADEDPDVIEYVTKPIDQSTFRDLKFRYFS